MPDIEERLAAKFAHPWLRSSKERDYRCQLDALGAMGILRVQTFYDVGFTPEAARAVHRAATERGMRADGMHYDYGTRLNLAATDEAHRRGEVARTVQDVLLCKPMGVSFVVVHPGGKYSQDSPATLAAFKRSAGELHGALAPHGMELHFENAVPGELCPDVGPLVAVLDELDLPMLGVCLDTGHAHLSGDVADMIRRSGRWLKSLHLHDNCGGPKDEHRAPFSGTIDWAGVVGALREIGYSGLYTIETDDIFPADVPVPGTPLEKPAWLRRLSEMLAVAPGPPLHEERS